MRKFGPLLALLIATAAFAHAMALALPKSERLQRDAALEVLLRPGGEWLTFERSLRAPGTLVQAFGSKDPAAPDRQLFHRNWMAQPGSATVHGGPDFDAESCSGCHIETLDASSELTAPLVARPAYLADRDRYGNQVTTRFVGDGAAEAAITMNVVTTTYEYPDGTTRQLTHPQAYAHTRDGNDIEVVLRTAPLLFGWGLLESIQPGVLGYFHDPEDGNRDGISGRTAQEITDDYDFPAALGWKGSHATLKGQVAAALRNDMGVTSEGADREITEAELELLTQFVRRLGVPNRRTVTTDRGRNLFGKAGCSSCHVAAMLTREDAAAAVADQLIWPYSDFMLHDMGRALADPGDAPDAAEWRTAPLWGVGYAEIHLPQRGFLHDGRAGSIEEAVLWHGGEADDARRRFSALSARDRALLLDYVRSL